MGQPGRSSREVEGAALTGLDAVFAAGGEAGALMREIDWAHTALGPLSGWPQSLRSAVSICLLSRFPMVVWWGPDLVFIYNDAYRPVLGVKDPHQIMGRVGREVWPEIWPIIGPMLDGVMTKGEATWSDDQLLHLERNGYLEECYFTFSYSPIRDETGGVGGVFTAVTETTLRVVGERRLRTLSELAEGTSQAKTAEDACKLAAAAIGRNPADIPFALLYLAEEDGSAAELVASSGQPPAEAPVELRARADAPWPLAEVLAGGEARTISLARPGLDGAKPSDEPETALALAIPGQPRPAGVLVVGVSPRRALDHDYQRFFELVAGQVGTAIADAVAYQAERKRAEALAELDRAKTAFFSNVSHEFRTPLTLLLGPLEHALAILPADARSEIEIAHRNAMRLLRLVNTLLDFSRIEAGRVEAAFEPVDLSALTADLASAFRSATDAAGVELVVDCPPLLEPAYVDVEMWEKIVLNLISNAFKFTFEGRIVVRTTVEGDFFKFQVIDTGVGIPDSELPRLFDRFHRIRGARSRTHEGSGIGLSLVHELAALHGGSVAVESTPARGTTFTVSIPRGAAHLPPDRVGGQRSLVSTAVGAAPFVEEALRWLPGGGATEDTFSGEADLGRRETAGATQGDRILVVDDNADMREYLVGLLSPHWRVSTAADGQTALQMARKAAPELVLTDVMMPGLDGFQLLRALREDAATRDVPVVMLSARSGEEATVEGLEAGADDYLVKPFVARELVARIRANLELSRMRLLTRSALERYDQSEQALQRALTSIAAIATHIRAHVDMPTLYGRLSETAAGLLGARRVIFWRLEGGLLKGQAQAYGVEPDLLAQMVAAVSPDGDDLADRIVFRDELFNATIDASEEFEPYRHLLDALGARDAIAVPWKAGEQRLGLVAVYDSLKPGGFTRDDVVVLRIAALAAALVWEHRRAEDALAEAKDQEAAELRVAATRSAELERIKGEFLKLASHELRGPLSVIGGYLSMIEDGSLGPLSSELIPVVPILGSKVREMTLLVDQMLETARLEDQKLALQIRTFDLRDVVTSTIEAMRILIPPTHRLDVVLPRRALLVEGDASRLGTVLSNLIDNAVRYSPDGGTVEVRCTVRQSARQVMIEVTDQGLGISADDIPRLFVRFGRIVTADNSHISGTGLGLYLSQEIVRRHGGEISVRSQLHKGSTFSVTLPLAAPVRRRTEARTAPVGRRPQDPAGRR